jgi:hypothetical protein
MSRKIYLSILLFITLSSIYAQKKQPADYLVTNRGDTLRGQLQERPKAWDHQKVFFRAVGTTDWTAYGTNEAVALGLNGEQSLVARPATLNEQKGTYFLDEVAAGHLSVYAAINQQGEAVFFVQKGGAEVLPLHPKFYASLLSSLTSDCPNFMRNAKGEPTNPYSYLRSSLARMARDYNQCAHPNTVREVAKPKKKLKFSFGLLGGVSHSSIIIDAEPRPNWERTEQGGTSWTVGGLANLELGGPMSLQAELWATNRAGSYTYKHIFDMVDPRQIACPRITMLSLPILFRFDLNKRGKINPYLLAGPSFRLAHHAANDATFTLFFPSGTSRISSHSAKLGRVEYTGGVGVEWKQPTINFFLETRYNRMADSPETNLGDWFGFGFRTWQFLLGCRF